MNVLFKPECQIKKHVNDKVLFLKCVVEANPANVTYYWYHNDNIMSGRWPSVILTVAILHVKIT